jgi:nitroreductase
VQTDFYQAAKMLNRLKKIAKNLLAITWVRRAYDGTMRVALEVLAANRLTSLVYSVISIPTFNREQFAVLRGRRDYYRNLSRARTTRTELRRNIHRLEKGLSMQPRRAVFALDYLEETIEYYENAVSQHASKPGSIDSGELRWGHDVLDAYFKIADPAHPVIAAARERFVRTLAGFRPGDVAAPAPMAPYPRSAGARGNVAYQDLLALAEQRRSVRWFEQRPVPRELLEQALLVARQAPTACNRLPYQFRIYDDPALTPRIAAIPFGSAGYSHQIPAVVVVTGRLSHYFSPRDRHAIYVDASLAAMSFMLALETLGLSSSVINWPDFEPLEAKMQKTLKMEYDERVVMLIAVGYAAQDGMIPFSQKKSLDILRSYNDIAEA